MAFLALIIAIGIVLLFLPEFNRLAGKQIVFSLTQNPLLIAVLAGIAAVTGIISGTYPALFLSSFQPVSVLKGSAGRGAKGSLFRKTMIVLQFSFSIMLMACSIVVWQQLQYIQHKKLGFNKENLVYIRMTDTLNEKFPAVRDELTRQAGIQSVSRASHILTNVTHIHGLLDWEGRPQDKQMAINSIYCDHDFVRTMGMEIIKGNDFIEQPAENGQKTFIINEQAIREMGVADPVGMKIKYGREEGMIVGVVKDFHFKPLSKKIEPVLLANANRESFYLYLRINGAETAEALQHIRSVYNTFMPGAAFDPRFLDESLSLMYRAEERVGSIFKYFTALAIFISCLGLFGMAAYIAEQKTKEIGIRKALGAGTPLIVYLFTKEFSVWVLTANLLAWPAAYLVTQSWLHAFAYRIPLSITAFAVSGAAALAIALLTVSYQAIRAASAKPVDSLKYE